MLTIHNLDLLYVIKRTEFFNEYVMELAWIKEQCMKCHNIPAHLNFHINLVCIFHGQKLVVIAMRTCSFMLPSHRGLYFPKYKFFLFILASAEIFLI